MVAGKDRPRMLPYGTRWNGIGPPINSLLEIRKINNKIRHKHNKFQTLLDDVEEGT
jgi:hypothetical protein